MAKTLPFSSEKLFEKYGRNRTEKPEQADQATNYHPLFPPYVIYPIAVNDTLREMKKKNKFPTNPEELEQHLTAYPKAFSFPELLELLSASEIDALSHERKFEELYPGWEQKKRIVAKAREFYYNPENVDKEVNISVLPDETLKIGKESDCEYFTFNYSRLVLDITDVDRFEIQRSYLKHIETIVTQMEKEESVDGQLDRPDVVAYILDQRDFWDTLETTEDLPEQIRDELRCNKILFEHIYEQALDYPTTEDKELEEEIKKLN